MSVQPQWTKPEPPRFDAPGTRAVLARLDEPCHVLRTAAGIGVASGEWAGDHGDHQLLASGPPLPPTQLGSPDFQQAHGVRYAYMAGSMANGIASVDLVIALARAGFLGSFGAAGLTPDRIADALARFDAEIPALPYACNLIHSPHEPALERATVELYLARGVRCVEASAYLRLTPHIVRYRVAGLTRDGAGRVVARNRVIAKVSRSEVAEQFLRPAPEPLVRELATAGLVTEEQAELARRLPMADDITAEGDSAGHTDRRPLTVVVPILSRLRESICRQYDQQPRIGAAGGIGTPEAAAAAFALGADYIVTGSVNQACVEAGTAAATKRLLAQAGIADCAMAPAADMFELGVELQVLQRGTLFPMRARRLWTLYRSYDALEDLPEPERDRLEQKVFRRSLDEVWTDTKAYFTDRDPDQITQAEADPKRRMALVFRWYLGMSSSWANRGEPERTSDFQVWCGPAMGGFNDWVRGSYLAAPEHRQVVDVATELVTGAAFHTRVAGLRAMGAQFAAHATDYRPATAPPARHERWFCHEQPGRSD